MYTAEQLELPGQLEMADVVREANRLLKLVPDLADSAEFSERTIHYYVHKKLLPRRTGRGPGTTYAPGFVYRLLLIRLLQKDGLSLDEINARYNMADVNHLPDAVIADVLLGNEWLEAGDLDDAELSEVPDAFAAAPLSIEESDRVMMPPVASKARDTSKTRTRISASDRRGWRQRRSVQSTSAKESLSLDPTYGDAEFSIGNERLSAGKSRTTLRKKLADKLKSNKPKSAERAASVSYPLGPDAELVLRKELTPAQQRRLKHIAALLKDILDETE